MSMQNMKNAVLFRNVRALETLNYKKVHVISRARSPFPSAPAVLFSTSWSFARWIFYKRIEYLVNILKDEKKERDEWMINLKLHDHNEISVITFFLEDKSYSLQIKLS